MFAFDDGAGRKPRPFTCYGDDDLGVACSWFWELVDRFDLDPWQPSPDAAPWHVQAKVNGVLVNFWPHKNKMQVDGMPSVSGFDAEDVLMDLINDTTDAEVIFDDF